MTYYHKFKEPDKINIINSNDEILYTKILRREDRQILYKKLWDKLQFSFKNYHIFVYSQEKPKQWGFGSNKITPDNNADGVKAIWFTPTEKSQIISIQVIFNKENFDILKTKNINLNFDFYQKYEHKNNDIIGTVDGCEVIYKKLVDYGDWLYFKIYNDNQLEFVISYLKEIAPFMGLELADKL
jgi:hypothetical protein